MKTPAKHWRHPDVEDLHHKAVLLENGLVGLALTAEGGQPVGGWEERTRSFHLLALEMVGITRKLYRGAEEVTPSSV